MEMNNMMLMANYQSSSSLQIVPDTVRRLVIKILRKNNNSFRSVFEDLRVERDFSFENRLVSPRGMRQAVLSGIHSGYLSRDAMLGSADEIWWSQTLRKV